MSRTSRAVEQRLTNLQRRVIAARVAATACREEEQHELADLMEANIDRLNTEILAWNQWLQEGWRSPTLDKINQRLEQIHQTKATKDEIDDRQQAQPIQ